MDRNLADFGGAIRVGVDNGAIKGFALMKSVSNAHYSVYDSSGVVSQDDLVLQVGWNRASDGKGIVGFPKVLSSKDGVHMTGAFVGAMLRPGPVSAAVLCFYLGELFTGADSVPVYMPQSPVH